MGKIVLNECQLQELQEKLQEVLSIILILEADVSAECSDGIYYRVIKVVHRMLSDIQRAMDYLVQSAEESLK